MILDGEKQPSSVEAFQIKSASSNWTVRSLLKRQKGQGDDPQLLPSIAGKLYDLKRRFPDDVKLLQFVSNTSVSVKLKSDEKVHRSEEHTKFADLAKVERDAIKAGLKVEHELEKDPELDGVLEFAVTDIPVKTHSTHGAGRLSEFLNELFPQKQFNTIPLYKALLSEVALRNNNQRPITSFEELIKHKSITRATFNRVLTRLGVTSTATTWDEVVERLNSEEYGFAQLTAMKKEWENVVLDRLTRRDLQYAQLSGSIAKLCKGMPVTKLSEAVESVLEELKSKVRKEWDVTDAYLRSAITLEIYEPSEHQDAGTDTPEGKE